MAGLFNDFNLFPALPLSLSVGCGAGIVQKASTETALHIQGNEREAIIDKGIARSGFTPQLKSDDHPRAGPNGNPFALFGGEPCEQKLIEDKVVMDQLSAIAIAAAAGQPFVELDFATYAGLIRKASTETALHVQDNERKAIIDEVKEGKGTAICKWVEFLAKTLASSYTSGQLFFGLNERALLIIVPVAIKTLAQLILKKSNPNPVPCGFNPEEALHKINELTDRFVQQLLPRLSLPSSRAMEVGAGTALFEDGLANLRPAEMAAGAGLVFDGLRL